MLDYILYVPITYNQISSLTTEVRLGFPVALFPLMDSYQNLKRDARRGFNDPVLMNSANANECLAYLIKIWAYYGPSSRLDGAEYCKAILGTLACLPCDLVPLVLLSFFPSCACSASSPSPSLLAESTALRPGKLEICVGSDFS
jgi:hypothetical protein